MRLKWESHRISYQGWRGNLLALYVCEALDLISRTTEQLNENATTPEGWPKGLRPMQKTQFDSLLTPQLGLGNLQHYATTPVVLRCPAMADTKIPD